jgi:multiple sugar transport system substrate-binding protein
MLVDTKISRRQFLKIIGATASGAMLAACQPTGSMDPSPSQVPTIIATKQAPALIKPALVQVQLDGWAVADTNRVLNDPSFTDFSKQAGIQIQFIPRTGTKEEELNRLTAAVQAGTSPYDIIDFEDELTTSFSRSGFMASLNDLLPADFWDDFSPAMKAYSDVWSVHQGDLFRVIHNWEMPYWWYRKDWFDGKGVKVPTSWDEARALGEVFTDEEAGVWASEDTMLKGGYMNAYLSWITLQAGGNPFDVGDAFKLALEYIYELMHADRVLNPASLQKQILQQIADYTTDKLAFMRQWPFFYDLSRQGENASWVSEDKVMVALPPAGPGGKANSTYAASWGFGIVKTSPNLEAAKEAFRFLVSPEAAALMATASIWYVSARRSVLNILGDKGIVKWMKMYEEAGVIGVRPFHPKFIEATGVLEEAAMAFLSDQISLDNALGQAKDGLAKLGA